MLIARRCSFLLFTQALKRILLLRKYNGRVHFVPASGYEDYTEKISQKVSSIQDVPFSILNIKQTDGQASGHVGPDIDLKNMNWRTIEGPFVSVWVHNVRWGSEKALAAPNAQVCFITYKLSQSCCYFVLPC